MALETTIQDSRKSTFGQNVVSPKSGLNPVEYSRFINREFSASAVLKYNKQYTKVEIATVVEKDGSTSTYTVKGTGPVAMKEELVRILKLLPKSIPATRDGKPIRYRNYQPFEFTYKHEDVSN